MSLASLSSDFSRSHVSLLALTLIPVVLIFLWFEPIHQPQEYHDFADSRSFFGVPNFYDVGSNLAFFLTGLFGVLVCVKKNQGPARNAWITMFTGIALVSAGSAYYHLMPNNETLVWDRSAMTVGFMGLFVALLVEYVSSRLAVLLLPLVILGIGSVVYGYVYDDLRLYLCVQFIPLLMVPVVIAFFRGSHTHQWLLVVGLLCYLVAKASEHYDLVVFQLSGEAISGHTAKHLLAAAGCFCVLIMLMLRQPRVSANPSAGAE